LRYAFNSDGSWKVTHSVCASFTAGITCRRPPCAQPPYSAHLQSPYGGTICCAWDACDVAEKHNMPITPVQYLLWTAIKVRKAAQVVDWTVRGIVSQLGAAP
jgi:hypothetical protein